MSRKIHPDALAVKRCVLALERYCTSTDAIEATVRYLWDRYVAHPPAGFKARHLAERAERKQTRRAELMAAEGVAPMSDLEEIRLDRDRWKELCKQVLDAQTKRAEAWAVNAVSQDELIAQRVAALTDKQLLTIAEGVQQAGGAMMQWPSRLRAALLAALQGDKP